MTESLPNRFLARFEAGARSKPPSPPTSSPFLHRQRTRCREWQGMDSSMDSFGACELEDNLSNPQGSERPQLTARLQPAAVSSRTETRQRDSGAAASPPRRDSRQRLLPRKN